MLKLAFGSMRLLESNNSKSEWVKLLEESAELGITLWHSSDEYDSFQLFSEISRTVTGQNSNRQINHIIKLGEPHFDQLSFDKGRLLARVDFYLRSLAADSLYAVEWMWRGTLKDETRRLECAAFDNEEMCETFEGLKKIGKIQKVIPFPYTYDFGQWVLSQSWCDGLTCYLNPIEREMLPLAHRIRELGKDVVALRPLASGRAITRGRSAEKCFVWTITQPAVRAAIVSYSSSDHRDSLLAAGRASYAI